MVPMASISSGLVKRTTDDKKRSRYWRGRPAPDHIGWVRDATQLDMSGRRKPNRSTTSQWRVAGREENLLIGSHLQNFVGEDKRARDQLLGPAARRATRLSAGLTCGQYSRSATMSKRRWRLNSAVASLNVSRANASMTVLRQAMAEEMAG
jgi:hypothetical protein